MNTNVLPMRPLTVEPADAEKLSAYIVAIGVNQEIIHAPAITRALLVSQVIAGQRLAKESLIAITDGDSTRCATVLALMAQDAAIAEKDGWKW